RILIDSSPDAQHSPAKLGSGQQRVGRFSYAHKLGCSMSRRWINMVRAVQLLCGVFCLGTGLAFTVRASVGLAPWDVLSHGIMMITDLSFGSITILIGLIVMLLWIPLKEKPGIGTLTNVIGTGFICDLW